MVFNPDKFRALLERAYIQVGVPFVHMVQHLHRIFTWANRPRSTFFCLLYFSAWAASRLEGTFLLLVLALMVSQPLRDTLFPPLPGSEPPPAPASKAGVAANLMGLPVERDAARFVDAIGTMAASMVGLGPKDANAPDSQTLAEPSVPSTPISTTPFVEVAGTEDLRIPQTDEPLEESGHADHTVEELAGDADTAPSPTASRRETIDTVNDPHDNLHKSVWRAAAPFLFMLVTFVDTVERFGNALSPTPPFPEWEPRLKLGGIIGGFVLFVWSGLVSPSLIYHGSTLLMGAAMFGTPVLNFLFPTTTEVMVEVVDEVVDLGPGWRYDIQLRHSLLKGVPTNAQLAATLLRIAEQADKPMPPPPADPLSPPANGTGKRRPGQGKAKPQRAPSSDPSVSDLPRTPTTTGTESKPAGYKRAMFKNFLKTSAQLGTETVLGAGKVKASLLSSVPSKYGLAAPPSPAQDTRRFEGPVIFRARYGTKAGLLHILPYRDGVREPHLRWLPEGRMAGAMSSVTTFTGLDWSWSNGQSSLAAGKPSSRMTPSPAPSPEGYEPGLGEVFAQDQEGKIKLLEVDLNLSSINEVRKRGGMGFSSRVMLNWMLDIEAVDVLEIQTADKTLRFSDVKGREALFTRLVTLGPQRWEFV